MLLATIFLLFSNAQASYIDPYLADIFKNNREYCRLLSKDPSLCIEKIDKHIKAINECDQSPLRFSEMSSLDAKQFEEKLSEEGETLVPQILKQHFILLTNTASKLYPTNNQVKWELRGYKGKIKNAHSGVSGEILIANSLWKDSDYLTPSEIAAVLAHEIAHTVKEHSLKLGCQALAWATNADTSLKDAMKAFKEDISPGYPRGQAWQKLSQEIEMEADYYAVIILKAAGYNPLLMAEALEKIKPKSKGGFDSGSHPDMQMRIERARQLAKEL